MMMDLLLLLRRRGLPRLIRYQLSLPALHRRPRRPGQDHHAQNGRRRLARTTVTLRREGHMAVEALSVPATESLVSHQRAKEGTMEVDSLLIDVHLRLCLSGSSGATPVMILGTMSGQQRLCEAVPFPGAGADPCPDPGLGPGRQYAQ